MFRSVANNQAISPPPTNVNGTNTGFGQCNAPNKAPATTAAGTGSSNAAINRFVKNEFSATCCSKQNARYPPNLRGSIKCEGNRCSMPKNSPAKQINRELIPKNQADRFVARQRLSARQPIVFGVSPRAKKLTASHTSITRQVHGADSCSFQMNAATNPANANASAKHDHRYRLHFTPTVRSPSGSLPDNRPSAPTSVQTAYRCRPSPHSFPNNPSAQNPEIPGSSPALAATPAAAARSPRLHRQSPRTPRGSTRPQIRSSSAGSSVALASPPQSNQNTTIVQRPARTSRAQPCNSVTQA
jgi:hypothetical protein